MNSTYLTLHFFQYLGTAGGVHIGVHLFQRSVHVVHQPHAQQFVGVGMI